MEELLKRRRVRMTVVADLIGDMEKLSLAELKALVEGDGNEARVVVELIEEALPLA